VAKDVIRLRLARKHRFDLAAMRRLVAFNRTHRIQILHAHSASLFIAAVASVFPPFPVLVWHDNYGYYAIKERPAWLYRLAARRVSAAIAANQPLAEWSRTRLHISAERVRYLPNFVCIPEIKGPVSGLPGTQGARIVCVANFRPEKDHPALLRAMVRVITQVPTAHLLLIGAPTNPTYQERIRNEIIKQRLDQHVSLLGPCDDVPRILQVCDIGVLSSASEGLPLALLEYGMKGLPAVATSIGQCAEVLDDGRAGILVPVGSVDQLAQALVFLLQSPEQRLAFGNTLHRRVIERYSAGPVVEQVCKVYDKLLNTHSSSAQSIPETSVT
jgi:glycosyltransferase involved in cell wall biosynthesis